MTRLEVTTVPAERLLAAQVAAAAFFDDELRGPTGTSPRDYLARRGFASALESPIWCVGYAPPSWTALTNHLRRDGFRDSEILASGLGLETRRHTVVDRFRDRVMFGIRNEDDEVVAFIGRGSPAAGHDAPKYLNSPRSCIYDKSTLLFGLGDQRGLLTAGAVPVLVEGPLDALAISLSSADDPAPSVGVAPCGTSLTATHVRALAQATEGPVVVAFDSDAAGNHAAARSYSLLQGHFTAIRALRPPTGSDPAALLQQHGAAGLRAVLTRTTPLAERLVDDVLGAYADRLDNADARVCALRELAPIVATFRGEDVARQTAKVSSRLRLDQQTVTRELTEAVSPSRVSSTAPPTPRLSTGQRGPDTRSRVTQLEQRVGRHR